MSLESILLWSGVGLLTGIAIASLFWNLRQRKLEHVSTVRWSRRISDAEAARDENQARMDKALDEARERESRLKLALAENEETLALLSDEKVPAFELELTRRNERIAELEHKAAAYRARIADAGDELAMTNDSLEKARASLRDRDARLDALAGIENSMRKMRTQTDQQQKMVATLQTELSDRDRILALTRQKADAAKERQTELEQRIQTLSEQVRVQREGAETRLGELQSRLDDKHGQLQAAETQIAGLTAEADRHAEEYEARSRELTDLRQRLPELESARRQLQDAQTRIADMAGEADRRGAELEAGSRELAELRRRVSELDSARRQLHDAQTRIATLTGEADRRAAGYEAIQREVSGLRQQLSELETHLHQRNQTLSERGSEIDALTLRVTDLESALDVREQRIADLAGELQHHEQGIAEARAEARALRETRIRDQAHLEDKQAAIEKLNERIRDYENELPNHQKELHIRDQRIADLARELQHREQGIAEAREEARALRETRIRDQAHLEDKQAAIEKLNERIRDYENELPNYQKELRIRDQRIAAIHDEFTALREELPTLNDALREREASIEDLAKELTRQRERYATLQKHMIESGRVQAGQQPAQVIRLRERREQRSSAGRDAPRSAAKQDQSRPAVLADEPHGKADDLKRIRGVGPVLERRLNELGLFQFDQVAALGATDIEWVTARLKTFAGRIERDDWIGQARKLANDTRDDSKRSGG